jgi:hypothetical protein
VLYQSESADEVALVLLVVLRVLRSVNRLRGEAFELEVTWAAAAFGGAPGVVRALTPIPIMPATIRPETSTEAISELSCFILFVSLQAAL